LKRSIKEKKQIDKRGEKKGGKEVTTSSAGKKRWF